MSDPELLAQIRDVLATSPFVGEGHRKVWARLARRGVCTSRKRVLRLTREAGLLAPTAKVRKRAARLHDGTITVTVPDTLWATDATEGFTEEGRCAVFVMIDHASGEAWADAGLRMDRFAAADLLREVTTDASARSAATPEGLRLFADSLAPTDEVALEATCNTHAIAKLLQGRVGRVVISNPQKTRAIAEAKVKIDKVDAAVLAELLAADYLPGVWISDDVTHALRRQVARRAGWRSSADTAWRSSAGNCRSASQALPLWPNRSAAGKRGIRLR
jgi:hypothetical protein